MDNLTLKVDNLSIPEDVKVGVMNCLANDLDFALVDEASKSGAFFLNNRYMVTFYRGELSFMVLADQKALMNAISVAVLGHREFKLIDKLLSDDQQKQMLELAYEKTLP